MAVSSRLVVKVTARALAKARFASRKVQATTSLSFARLSTRNNKLSQYLLDELAVAKHDYGNAIDLGKEAELE